MKKKILFVGFGLDPKRVEAVSKNTLALKQLLNKKLHLQADYISVSYRQSSPTGLDKKSLLDSIKNKDKIIKELSEYITKNQITHVHDVFVLSAASVIFTLPLKKLHPDVFFIKEVHNSWGFSKQFHTETMIRLLFNSKFYSGIIKRNFDKVITRKIYLAKKENLIFVPPFLNIYNKKLHHNNKVISFCYLGHSLKKKGVYEFPKLFKIIPGKIKNKIVFNFALSNLGQNENLKRILIQSAQENNIKIKINSLVKPEQFFRQNDVFILPIHDRFGATSTPNTILEAMEANCLVITTNIESLRGIAENNKNILLISDFKAKNILQKILFVINYPNKIKDLTNTAREKVISYCSQEKIIETLKSIYD